MIPTPTSKTNCQISVKEILFFRINNISTIKNASIKGKIIILEKDCIPHFVIFKTIKVNPKVDTKVLKNTAMEVPNIFQCVVKGYINAANTNSLTICHIGSISGLLTARNIGPVVAWIDLTKPDKTNTWTAGTMGIHLSPKNICVNSGARINIPPANGIDINAVSCNTLRYAFLSLGKSSCNFE